MFWQPSTSKGVCLSQLTLDVTVVWISTKWQRHQMSGDSENKHWCNLLHNYVWQSATFVWFGINMALGSEGLAFCLHQPACICLSVDLCVYFCALFLTSPSLLTQGSFSSPGILPWTSQVSTHFCLPETTHQWQTKEVTPPKPGSTSSWMCWGYRSMGEGRLSEQQPKGSSQDHLWWGVHSL